MEPYEIISYYIYVKIDYKFYNGGKIEGTKGKVMESIK